jgi:hypothetical protein
MPVRTHERHQASRGGLNGSDGSGWTLLAVREEARRRRVEVREHRGDGLRRSNGHTGADEAGHGAEGRTEIALVRSAAGLVRGATAGTVMADAMVVRSDLVVLVFVPRRARFMAMRVLGQLNLGLKAKAAHRTQHARSQRAPNGEQHGKQKQEPEAKGLHSS